MFHNRYTCDNVSRMSKKLTWVDFLNRLPGKPSDRAIAAAAGVSHSAVSRWRDGQPPKPGQASAVAAKFGLHPLNGLVAAGYMTLDDVDALFTGKQTIEVQSIDDMSTLEIVEYLAFRLRANTGSE